MAFVRKIKIRDRTYLVEVEGYRDKDGKVRQRFRRYLGKVEDGKLIEPKYKRLEIKRLFPAGIQLMVKALAEEHGISVDNRLLCLATMHLINPSSLNQVTKNFLRFGLDTFFGDISRSQFYTSLDMGEEEIYRLEIELYQGVKKARSVIFYDITSIYFYGSSCALAKRGYNPKGMLPQINIGLAVDREGIPLFHKIFRGNVHSASTLYLFIECLKNAGIKGCMLILDRGFFSMKNIQLVTESDYHIIVGVPLRGRFKVMMKKIRKEMRSIVLLKSTYIYVKEIPWEGGKLVFCYNEGEASNLKNLILRRRKKKDIELLGCYALFCSNRDLETKEVVKRYFEKDLIEKSFRSLKSVLGLSPVRHWLEWRINSHLFVCYLSYLILKLLERKLSKEDISVFTALDELKYVYKLVTTEGIEKIVATTKMQKKILKILKINI